MRVYPRSQREAGGRSGLGKRSRLALVAVVAAVVLAPVGAQATVVIGKSFAQLCGEADLIFVGTVEDVESRWSGPGDSGIETLVTFGDLTALRGARGPTVALRFGGGEIDGVREEFAGLPHFAVGQRGVIFARDEHTVSPIVGFHQGCFQVVDGGVWNVGGRPVVAVDGAVLRLGERDASPPGAMSLEEFLDAVRREIARQGDSER